MSQISVTAINGEKEEIGDQAKRKILGAHLLARALIG